MSLLANIHIDSCGNISVLMKGDLSYDTGHELRGELFELCRKRSNCQITIDFYNLDFVGSSGIGFFVETINAIGLTHKQIRLINVRREFSRVFQLYQLANIPVELLDEENDGINNNSTDRLAA